MSKAIALTPLGVAALLLAACAAFSSADTPADDGAATTSDGSASTDEGSAAATSDGGASTDDDSAAATSEGGASGPFGNDAAGVVHCGSEGACATQSPEVAANNLLLLRHSDSRRVRVGRAPLWHLLRRADHRPV